MAKLILLFLVWGSVICLSSGISTENSINGLDLNNFSSGYDPFLLFQQWKNEYNRAYETLEEHDNRFQVFKTNVEYIIEMNSKRKSPHSYTLGLNKFADLKPEEFKNIYLNKMEMPKHHSKMKTVNHSCKNVPASLDWRRKGVVTPVKKQGRCHSCWAFAATGAIEAINAIVTGNLVRLSEQALVDCDPFSNGCEGGWVDRAFEWVINNGGTYTEATYPYAKKNLHCQATKQGKKKAVTIDGYVRVAPSEDALLCASIKQPVTVYLDSTDILFYKEGIYDGAKCSNDPYHVDHAVLIVGYDSKDDQDYWIIKNSWGEDWGENGYIRIKRNIGIPNGLCAINAWNYYPTKSH
ncbi:hypothetical protein L6164_031804 [Bauhinia variegata]|uniref:Uncharacterized protein n=1 Tax=Bauhinia variegata TaxID=167791 RepID=A0ACB9KM19_BAUVA|nr:hypothetical protein L6164_031804 [Bauhinia variegata]